MSGDVYPGLASDEIIDNDVLEMSVSIMKTLSDPARLQMLWALSFEDRTLSELAQLVGVSPAAASQLLTKLRASGVLQARKEGRHTIYSMHDGHSRDFIRQTLVFARHRLAEHTESETA